jgi:MoaA/NifB/PqqE/SkfB family radical SAM enzyme
MCYQIDQQFSNKSSGYMGHMKFSLFREIVDELVGNIEAVTFASRGEPLLNPEIFKMLHYTNGKFLATKINTNASLLTEEASHQILSSGVRIVVFSVDASDKATYEKIRVNGSYDKVLKNIEKFHEIRTKHYPTNPLVTKVSGVKLGDYQDIENLKTTWNGLVDDVAYVQYNPWEVAYDQPVNNVSTTCTELYRRMFIWWDGRYNPCDFDYRSELTKDVSPYFPQIRINEFWNGSFYNQLRMDHESKNRANRFPCNRCRAA